ELYRKYRKFIEALNKKLPLVDDHLNLSFNYEFSFMAKYKQTLEFITKHGKNILSYSFIEFIKQEFNKEVLYETTLTRPSFLPPEWEHEEDYPNTHLNKRLLIRFERTSDNRLRLVTVVGPIPYKKRLAFLESLEKIGLPIREMSKKEAATYTQFFAIQTDINKWEDHDTEGGEVLEELTDAMLSLYHNREFRAIKAHVASFFNGEEIVAPSEKLDPLTAKEDANAPHSRVQQDFLQWMKQM